MGRVLLFCHFVETLNILETVMKMRGHSYFRMDGSTDKVTRELDIREFNAPGSPKFIYLISTKAGGVGINLATADCVVCVCMHVSTCAFVPLATVGTREEVLSRQACCKTPVAPDCR